MSARVRSRTARLSGIDLPDFGLPDREPVTPATIYRDRLAALRARAAARGYDRLVVYADREHSANLAWLTGFDPRFEEALLVVGPDGDPAILVGNECFGMAGAAPLPMRRVLFQDLSLPGPAAGPVATARRHPHRRGRRTGRPDRRRRLEDVRRPVDDRGPGLHRRRAAPPDRRPRARRERDRPVHRRRRRPARGQRRRRPRRARMGIVSDLEWRPAPALGAPTGHDRARGGPPARLERDAAVVPSDADRRAASVAGAAQPGRPPDRARRPVHGRVRDLGRAHLSGRVRRGRCDRAAGADRRLRRATGRAVFRGDRGVVRGASRRPDGRGAPRHHRASPRRPVLRHLPQPGPPDRARRMGQLSDLRRLDDRAPIRDGLPGRRHPGDRDGPLHDQHRGWHRPRRRVTSRGLRGRPSGGLGTGRGAPDGSWPTRSASSSTRMSCRSRTSRPICRRSSSGPTGP